MTDLAVIGVDWQAAKRVAGAERGLDVVLYEMRPFGRRGRTRTAHLAELVCSNSLGSALPYRASGLLKLELARLGSMLLQCAQQAAVPAGTALAVDREGFAALVTQKIEAHPSIHVQRQEISHIPAGSASSPRDP